MQEVAPDNQAEGVEVPTCHTIRKRSFTLAPALHALRAEPKQFKNILKKKLIDDALKSAFVD
jgi:hypothetical protein